MGTRWLKQGPPISSNCGIELCLNHVFSKKTLLFALDYFEIVTPDVDAAVALYYKIHGVSFGVADENLGGARTGNVANGGTLGIRASMRS
jgi:hypothetical protein